jgi:hypothetical protein
MTSEAGQSTGNAFPISNSSLRTASIALLIAAVFTPLDLLAFAITTVTALYICFRISRVAFTMASHRPVQPVLR